TMSVPLKLDPTPITVFGSVGTSTFVVRLRNFMKVPFCSTGSEGACDRFHQGTGARPSRSTTGSGPVLPRSENPPSFEQTLEVLLGVVLELHFPAFTTGGDCDVRAELLLQPRLPFHQTMAAGRKSP